MIDNPFGLMDKNYWYNPMLTYAPQFKNQKVEFKPGGFRHQLGLFGIISMIPEWYWLEDIK